MTRYALYENGLLVKVADNLEGWKFHPYRGNRRFIEIREKQARRLEQELLRREELERLLVQK